MSLERFLLRQRLRPWVVAAILAVLLAGVVYAERRGWLLYRGDDLQRYHEQYFEVTRVVDGDTLRVAARDGQHATTRVRLIGVDTPELARPREGTPDEPLAEEAREYVVNLVRGERVRLDLEPHSLRDRYGRLLAYVTLDDGRCVNEAILLAGLAKAETRWPHRDRERYLRLEEQARHDRVGVWKRE